MFDVTLGDFAAAHSTGAAQVVDVREPAEYVTGHVPGAVSIPMGQLPGRLGEIDRSKPVFVVCQADPSTGREDSLAVAARARVPQACSVRCRSWGRPNGTWQHRCGASGGHCSSAACSNTRASGGDHPDKLLIDRQPAVKVARRRHVGGVPTVV